MVFLGLVNPLQAYAQSSRFFDDPCYHSYLIRGRVLPNDDRHHGLPYSVPSTRTVWYQHNQIISAWLSHYTKNLVGREPSTAPGP